MQIRVRDHTLKFVDPFIQFLLSQNLNIFYEMINLVHLK